MFTFGAEHQQYIHVLMSVARVQNRMKSKLILCIGINVDVECEWMDVEVGYRIKLHIQYTKRFRPFV